MGSKLLQLITLGLAWLICDFGNVIHRNYGVDGADLMFHLYAGKEDCFYEYLERNKTMYVEYTVIGSGSGDSDVNFQITDPHSRPVVTEFRKSRSTHEIIIPEGGQYKICFDNTYSHFTQKQITFTITTTHPDEIDWQDVQEHYFPEGSYDVQVNEIKERIDRVRVALNEMETHQEQYRILELRDRSVAEHNFERVNFWSTIFLLSSVTIGGLQVILLKGMLDPHYDVRHYVKKLVR